MGAKAAGANDQARTPLATAEGKGFRRAALNRLHDLDLLAGGERGLLPLAARQHLTVNRSGEAAPLLTQTEASRGIEHGRGFAQLNRLAVQLDPHLS